MKNRLKILSAIILSSAIIFGQSSKLFIPLNIQNAINNGTRTNNGLPGINYWQNGSDYTIEVEVLPDKSYLIGQERIKYHNNSPDSLKSIVVRLYQDINKYGAARDAITYKNELTDGVKINSLIIGKDTIDINIDGRKVRRRSTNMYISLKNKIAPKSMVELKIEWEVKIPKFRRLRMGNYGNGNLYIAYWYPQISVYDDIDGWDLLNYGGTVEFYNDFSNYNVSITVPKGMAVWATGELQNAKEVLRKDIYEKYEMAKQSDETVQIISQSDYENGLITADNEKNTWHFEAKNVTDFSFAASRSFNWDGASVVVDPKTGRRALTDVVYKDGTIHYDEASQYARETIKYLSNNLPGYPYPYSHATTFCNGMYGGGMESPMMENDGAPAGLASHVGLISHEISHNYFPFIMGTNERKYAWMDEGWAAFFPTEIVQKYDADFDYKKRRVNSYATEAGKECDLPLLTPSYNYNRRNTGLGFYDRPANAYYELRELLGDELFKECLLEYIHRWKGKHPIPLDFFNTFNKTAQEDLTWFWKPWFYEFGYPDLAISDVESNNYYTSVVVRKMGNIPTRVEVTIVFDDNSTISKSESARVWKNQNNEITLRLETTKNVKRVILGNKYIPDSVPGNNLFEL